MMGAAAGTWKIEVEHWRPQDHRVTTGRLSLNLSRLVFVRFRRENFVRISGANQCRVVDLHSAWEARIRAAL